MDTAYNANMTIDSCDSLIRPRLQKFTGDDFLHSQHDTILASNTDSCAAVLDRLDSIFHL